MTTPSPYIHRRLSTRQHGADNQSAQRQREKRSQDIFRRVRLYQALYANLVTDNVTSSPLAPAPALLMRLPAELRNLIYEIVLVDQERKEDIRIYRKKMRRYLGTKQTSLERWREPALLQVSNEIRKEAASIYYAGHCFVACIDISQMSSVCAWLRTVVNLAGNRPFKQFGIMMRSPSWTSMSNLSSLVELMRETGLQLSNTYGSNRIVDDDQLWRSLPARGPSSVFSKRDPHAVEINQCLDDFVELGERAWKEDWSSEKLRRQLRPLRSLRGL